MDLSMGLDRFLMSPRCSKSQGKTDEDIRMCILMISAYGWTDHSTSSSHEGYQCAEMCSYQVEYLDR